MHGNFGQGARRLRTAPKACGLVALAFVGLAACSSDDEVYNPCPRIVVVKDAQTQVRFIGDGRDLTDVAFEARIDGNGIACEYDDAEIEVEMQVRLEVARGPAAPREGADVSYFVAVARSDRAILAREEFGLSLDMPGNNTRVVALDDVSPTIPLRAGETGADYLIYLGLSLSDDELNVQPQRTDSADCYQHSTTLTARPPVEVSLVLGLHVLAGLVHGLDDPVQRDEVRCRRRVAPGGRR